MEPIGTAIETASGASILADDYPFATIHLATFCERGSRRIELLFGWVELLPHGFPQPRSTAPDCKSFRTSVAGLVCHSRTAMTGQQALDWYGEAARGRLTTPAALDGVAVKSAGIAVATDFAGQMTWPDTGIFIGSGIGEALVYELPFLPDWIHQPRINRTTPTPSPRLQGIVTHPLAAAWLGERIWLDFGLHPEWLGAVTLIAPNPLWSEMHHRKLPPEDAGPQSLLRFVPRPGADLTGLRITTYEQKLGMIGDVRAGRLGDASAIEALEEALACYGKPVIFNSDQGSQFTSTAFTAVLHREKVAISMDGKGCWRDNVFVERLWRSVKYEEVYLHAYASVPEARAGIGRYIGFYNAVRPHSALGGRTPDQVYFDQPLLAAA